MSQKTKERILYIIGVIFITAVCVSSCETQGSIQESVSKEKTKMTKLQKVLEVLVIFLGWILVAPKYIIDIFKSKFKK